MDTVAALRSLARGMLDGITRRIGITVGKGPPFLYLPSWVPTVFISLESDLSFKQYTPAKHTKHSLEICCLCCAYTGVILSFKVYQDKEDNKDDIAIAVCLFLCSTAGILNAHGYVLYANNYHTSVKLAKHLYKNHNLTLVGIISPTKKKHHKKEYFPFLKLLLGALNTVPS